LPEKSIFWGNLPGKTGFYVKLPEKSKFFGNLPVKIETLSTPHADFKPD